MFVGGKQTILSSIMIYMRKTRKPCYRKDDRAMRPTVYMGALKIFGIPCMATPTANFPDIFNGLLFRSIPWLCVQNLKFVPYPLLRYVGLIVIDWSFGWRFQSTIFRKRRTQKVVGVGDGTVRKSVDEFLWSNFSSIFTRFRDIAAFVLLHCAHHFPQWLTYSLLRLSPYSPGSR